MTITAHMIVKNEDRFVGYAIRSVLPFVNKFIIYDTGSTDKTIEIIKAIKSPKILFEEKGPMTPQQLVHLRNEQIIKTETDFFILVDGDEIWPEKNFEHLIETAKSLSPGKQAVVCRTRNAVGDIYHYLTESFGQYNLAGRVGHLTMRLIKNSGDIKVKGNYPLEAFYYKGIKLNDANDLLEFCDTWYLHLTHLSRSTSKKKVMGFRKKIFDLGLELDRRDLPKALRDIEFKRRSKWFVLVAIVFAFLRRVRKLLKI